MGSGTYAQGVLAGMVYLRGDVVNVNRWAGNFYYMGVEGIQGTFSFTFNTVDFSSYSGEVNFRGIASTTMAVNDGARTSATRPAPEDCWETDIGFLGSTYTANGKVMSADNYYDASGQQIGLPIGKHYQSYWYTFAATKYTGYAESNCFELNHICQGNWHEGGGDTGIQIQVAKNASHYWLAWYFVSSASTWQGTAAYSRDNNTMGGGLTWTVTDPSRGNDAQANFCMVLQDKSQEETCLKGLRGVSSASTQVASLGLLLALAALGLH